MTKPGTTNAAPEDGVRSAQHTGRILPTTQAGPLEPRCGPWDEQEDGSFICRKCGDIDWPGSGPMGF
jgi:hypothetical protein